jgi:hypothetical protein
MRWGPWRPPFAARLAGWLGGGDGLAAPGYGLLEAVGEVGYYFVAEGILGEGDVGYGVLDVAFALGGVVDGAGVAGDALDVLVGFEEGDAAAGGYVEDLAGDVGGGGSGGEEVGGDDVVDVGEVATGEAVAVDGGGLAGEHEGDEAG